ncbi:antitoxin VbhA family protein [Sulfitobacter sp. KE42]|uniref:antitoxin VbhA family protein n=1 Tax=Sulfitobacter sp. KE42 TaxID=2731155 RepID=UPI0023E0C8AC|nr:antitoxin VbhA family protein [Sulfitobacter sp. KE42]MDF3435213.1 antitoxin VbhA family protein [Sulfitobacter sp. KE42]
MTTSDNNASISPEEIDRRRKAMAKAVWSARMEGFGTPDAESEALSELWITGQINHEEMENRRMALVMDHVREYGH